MSRFTVLQFNMQFGQVWDAGDPDRAPVDLGATIAEIRDADADLVLLQEVEHVLPGGRRPEPPANYPRLQEALPQWHSVFAYPPASERELPFGIGLAIFSKTPLTGFVSRPLPAADIEFEFDGRQTSPTERLVIGATTVIDGRVLRIFNTHLQAYFMIGATSEDFPEQRQVVESMLRESLGPTIIGGDFNLGPGETLVRQYELAGFRTCQQERPTWKRRPYTTDHIFHSRELRCAQVAVRSTNASDHDTVLATLEFR